MAISVTKIQDYMRNDLNVMISGLAGTGKTEMTLQAASNLGLTMKYYSAPTLDPYVDLIGVPVPDTNKEQLSFYRPKDIDDAEIVFFDELNRADPKTLNAVFEMIQKKSLNGVPLPKLRMVIAAINPNDGNYQVDELDPALVDRFDMYLQADPAIDMPYFKKLFGAEIAKAVHTFWNDYERQRKNAARNSRNAMGYISPRRMEKIVSAFLKMPQRVVIVESLPPDANISPNELFNVLNKARLESLQKKSGKITVKTSKATASGDKVDRIIAKGASVRHKVNREKVIAILKDERIPDDRKQKLVSFVATHLAQNVGPERLVADWAPVLTRMTNSDGKLMTNSWAWQKSNNFNREVSRNGLRLNFY